MRLIDGVRASLGLLDPSARTRYRLALVAQVLLAFMDLIGVLLVGLVGLIAAAAGTGSAVPAPAQSLVEGLGLGSWQPAAVAAVLGIAAAVILTVKGVLSLVIQRRVTVFLADRVVTTARWMVQRFLSQPLPEVRRRPSSWNAYALMEGLTHAITGALGQFLLIVGDVSVLVVLGIALLLFDPMTTLVTLVYFGAVVMVMNRWLGAWSEVTSRAQADANIAARDAVEDAVATYRETSVNGRREFFRDRFVDHRTRYAGAVADSHTIAVIPRFAMEIALVVGALLLVGTLVVSGGTLTDAVGGLALFLAAVARVMPCLLRLNSSTIGLRFSVAAAERTMTLWEEMQAVTPSIPALAAPPEHPWDPVGVEIDRVSLRYPSRRDLAVHEVSLSLRPGQALALVGPTGAGKSSLVDVILGVIEPTHGSVRIDGQCAADIIAARPGALAYVPQNVAIVHGTVRENVALGLSGVDDRLVWTALDRAHLGDFVRQQDDQLDVVVGERGVRLSGGQRQRLGLARALYSIPSLLVLDEATSSLDAQTEVAIAETIRLLGSQVTTITVAHRLATIRAADVVAYLDGGRLVATGTFDEVRAAVPQFEEQARLLGL